MSEPTITITMIDKKHISQSFTYTLTLDVNIHERIFNDYAIRFMNNTYFKYSPEFVQNFEQYKIMTALQN